MVLRNVLLKNNNNNFSLLEKAKPETVIQIDGKVVLREKGTENND